MVMLLWASKSVTAKIGCIYIASKWQVNTFGGAIYFAGDGTLLTRKKARLIKKGNKKQANIY